MCVECVRCSSVQCDIRLHRSVSGEWGIYLGNPHDSIVVLDTNLGKHIIPHIRVHIDRLAVTLLSLLCYIGGSSTRP